ncbi:TIR domain-containing protein [Verrucomicrobium sp. BvORR106]|uniref:nSTAND1 domain-containing NTPase n=1 Tax=Verrucomicrobium sp. BvORR106 TaxID=1403819 RepID=UPI00056FE89F|nr:TIR domain-containing protein [Verrucomicrobium sp. BvORR106]
MPPYFEYDVFLSHNSQDKPIVRALAEWLRRHGVKYWLDENNLEPGDILSDKLGKAMERSRSALICIGPHGEGDWMQEEVNSLLGKAIKVSRTTDEFRIIPVLLPGANTSNLRWFLKTRLWVDLTEGLTDKEAELHRLKQAIQGKPDTSAPDEPKLNPYRGLEAFQPDDASFFFGRTAESKALATKVRDWRFAVIVGPSGNGKSSLARAGLATEAAMTVIPDLGSWKRLIATPGNHFLREVLTQLFITEPDASRSATVGAALERILPGNSQALPTAEQLAAGLDAELRAFYPKPEDRVLVIIDQLEEIFTHRGIVASTEEEQRNRARVILDGLVHLRENGDRRWHIVLSLRSDFEQRCRVSPSFWNLLEKDHHRLKLKELDDEGWREAIKGPAARSGAYLEAGLVETMVKDVYRQRGSMPLLQLALQSLWTHRVGACLTHAAYTVIGGVEKALQNRAEDCLKQLCVEGTEHLDIAKNLFLRLTSPGEGVTDSRRRLDFDELDWENIDQSLVSKVVAFLTLPENRLIVTDSHAIEITHEVLITDCGTIRGWIEHFRHDIPVLRSLTHAAKRWQNSEKEERLLNAAGPLPDLTKWLKATKLRVTLLERAYWKASRANVARTLHDKRNQRRALLAAEKQRTQAAEAAAKVSDDATTSAQQAAHEAEISRQHSDSLRRKFQLATIVAGSLVIVALLAFGIAFGYYRTAEDEKEEADRQRVAAFDYSKKAKSERRNAEITLNQVLLNFRDSLRKEGRLHLLEAAVPPAQNYFKNPTSGEMPDVPPEEQHALFLFTAGDALLALGRTSSAREMLEECKRHREYLCKSPGVPAHWKADLARTYDRLAEANIRDQQGSRSEAVNLLKKGGELRATIVGKSSPSGVNDADWRHWHVEWARQCELAGDLERDNNDLATAEAHYKESIRILELIPKIGTTSPEVQASNTWSLCQAQVRLGHILIEHGKAAEGEKLWKDARTKLEHCRKLSSDENYLRSLASVIEFLGNQTARDTRRTKEAEELWREALALRKQAQTANTGSLECQRYLALTHHGFGNFLLGLNRYADAEIELKAAETWMKPVYQKRTTESDIQSEWASMTERLGDVAMRRGQPQVAAEYFNVSLASRLELYNQDMTLPRWSRELSASYERLGDCQREQKQFESAVALYRQATDLRRAMTTRSEDNCEAKWLVALGLLRQGEVQLLARKYQEAPPLAVEAAQFLESACKDRPTRIDWRNNLAAAHTLEAEAWLMSGNYTSASRCVQKSLAIFRNDSTGKTKPPGSDEVLLAATCCIETIAQLQNGLKPASGKTGLLKTQVQDLQTRLQQNPTRRWENLLAHCNTVLNGGKPGPAVESN